MPDGSSTSQAPRQREQVARQTALRDLVALKTLQRVQDWFAETIGISVVIRDLHGIRVTEPNYQNRFTELIMESDAGERACIEAYLRAVKEAVRKRELARYTTRASLLQFMAPIFVEDVAVGAAVMGGPPESRPPKQKLTRLARESGVSYDNLASTLNDAIEWTPDRLAQAATMVSSVANTISWLCIQGATLRAKLRELESLFNVSQHLAFTFDLKAVLKLVARSAVEALAAKGCSVRLLSADQKELEIKSYYNLSRRYRNKGRVILDRSPIDKASLEGEIVHIQDVMNDPRILYPKEAEKEGIRSGISVGLISKRRPVGTLHVYRGEPGGFNESETQLLASLANLAAVAIDNAQLYEQAEEKRRMERDLRIAGEIQTKLLPAKPPEIEHVDLATVSIPCQEVGGDFFDFVPLRGGKVACIIADVAGKGVPGALLMASARATVRAYLERTSHPREAVGRLNVALCHDTQAGHFVSLFCAVVDPKKRTFTYTNAGHNPPLLLRKRKVVPLEEGGLVLAAEEEERYEERQIELRKDDLILLYTDGVSEALNAEEEVFGMERLVDLLSTHRKRPAEEIIRELRTALKRHTRGVEQSDDITMIAMRIV